MRPPPRWLLIVNGGRPPIAPSNLSVGSATTSALTVSWTDNSTNETGFEIERSTDNVSFSLIHTTAANATSYQNTGLTDGTTYYYRVRSVNNRGQSSYTSTASSATVLTDPTNLSVGSATTTALTLTWTDNSATESGFKIERSPNGTDNWVEIHTTAANATSYQNTGLSNNTTYYYRVRATNSTGNSSYTSVANGTTLAVPSALNFRAATTASNTSFTTTLAINVPAGVTNGDMMLMGIGCSNDTTITNGLSAWTLVDEITGTKSIRVYKRVASSEPASYTITVSASNYFTAGIAAFYSGTGRTIIVEDFAQGTNSSGTTHAAPSVDASQNATMACFFTWGAATTGSTTDLTERYDQSGTGQGSYCGSVSVSAGATGTKNVTSGTNTTSKTISVAIVEVVA